MPPASALTLGLEEELQLVDSTSAELTALEPTTLAKATMELGNCVSCEPHCATLEIKTNVVKSVDDALVALAAARGRVRHFAKEQGALVLSAGLHPFSSWREQLMHDDPVKHPYFSRHVEQYQDVARSVLCFGTHIHVGLPDPAALIPVMNGLREVLPELLALSASSPFHEGRDTGMASWRQTQIQQLPRVGIPDVWGSLESYDKHVELLRHARCVQPGQDLWEDVRVHGRFRTLEIRVCDAMPSLERTWLTVALAYLEAQTLVAEWARSDPAHPLPSALLNENKWRARRFGMRARFVDWRAGRDESFEQRMSRWVERVAPAADEAGLLERLRGAVAAAIAHGSSADQQRTTWRTTNDMPSVVFALVRETAQGLA